MKNSTHEHRWSCGLFIIICSGTEQIGDFLLSCRPDSGIFMEHSLPTVWATIGQRGAFKAVMTGIAEIVIQMCSPQVFVLLVLRRVRVIHIVHQVSVDGDDFVKI